MLRSSTALQGGWRMVTSSYTGSSSGDLADEEEEFDGFPLQQSHSNSSITSAISTDSLADNSVPEAEGIKDGHTIRLEPKPFASGGRPGSLVSPIQVTVKVLRVSGLAEDMTTDHGKQLSQIDRHLAREMNTWQKVDHKRITSAFGYMGSNNTVISERDDTRPRGSSHPITSCTRLDRSLGTVPQLLKEGTDGATHHRPSRDSVARSAQVRWRRMTSS
ncbi:hypothetical protein FRB93_011260 [Tulasnella sp. JGI-2019a]|nr:hypothetical protein FRB93_011260 [Tulasnella sp. JGI-2019a]